MAFLRGILAALLVVAVTGTSLEQGHLHGQSHDHRYQHDQPAIVPENLDEFSGSDELPIPEAHILRDVVELENTDGSGDDLVEPNLDILEPLKQVESVLCSYEGTPRLECNDCYTRLRCWFTGGYIIPCYNSRRPYCNNGICSSEPTAECAVAEPRV